MSATLQPVRRTVLVVVLVLGALVTGIGLWRSTGRSSAGFGWTAYSPLSSTAYAVFLQPPWWALALVVIGAATAGAAVALLVASLLRSRRRVSAGGGGEPARG